MAVEIVLSGHVVSRSKNLAGIIRYSAAHLVRVVSIWREKKGEGRLKVEWANGATCETKFADFSVLSGWIRARRNFQGANLFIDNVEIGPLLRSNKRVLETIP